MRAIDGDSVRDEILYGEAYVSAELEVYIKRVFDEAPTLDYKDLVPQGEWIYHMEELSPADSTQECSRCHKEVSVCLVNDSFCPNCGARMKGAANE